MAFVTVFQAARCGLKFASLTLLVWILGIGSAWSSGFIISPVRIDLSKDKRVAALKVSNPGDAKVSIQVDVYSWHQTFGKDELEDTSDLLVTPPIFTIPPGSGQIVRVGLRSQVSADMEAPYRLHLTEIPSAQTQTVNGLSIATRISLPVFVEPLDGQAQFKLDWKGELNSDGDLLLIAQNNGDGHSKITGLTIRTQGEVVTQ